MKKCWHLLLHLLLCFCVCGCKGTDTDNFSSADVEVEHQEIIIDKTGSTDTQTNQSDTPSENNSSAFDTPSQSTLSSNTSSKKPDIVIDYNTVVEVDICDDVVRGYLDASDASNQYFWLSTYSGQRFDYQAFSLDWYRDRSFGYTLYFSENADFSNAITITTNYSNIENSILIPGKTYYWKAIGTITSDTLGGGKVKIKDAPVRWIQIDGTGNVRDMGGWTTASGKTVKYSMLYRGQNIDNISDKGIATIKQLGLKTELDLRYAHQKNQKEGTGMNYVFLETSAQYDHIFKGSYGAEVKTNYREIFKLLSNESNYPFYTHCSAGADRTGVFAFLLNGVLGVSYEDLTRDFELTSFSPSGKRWRGNGTGGTFGGNDLEMKVEGNYVAWGKLYKGMMDYGAENGCTTLQSSIEHWLLNYVGVPQSQIDSFKSIMLG